MDFFFSYFFSYFSFLPFRSARQQTSFFSSARMKFLFIVFVFERMMLILFCYLLLIIVCCFMSSCTPRAKYSIKLTLMHMLERKYIQCSLCSSSICEWMQKAKTTMKKTHYKLEKNLNINMSFNSVFNRQY